MTATYYKRTSIPDALEAVAKALPVAAEVKIELLGNGSIVQIETLTSEADVKELNDIFYERGWANDLKTLSKK